MPSADIRLAELCATLSLACDLALGQGVEAGIRSTLLSIGLASQLGLSPAQQSEVFYLNLLRMAGCTASPEMAQRVGDLRGLGEAFDRAGADFGDRRQAMPLILRYVTKDRSALDAARGVARMVTTPPSAMRSSHRAHCDVAKLLAERMAATPAVVHHLDFIYERFDGSGTPNGVAGEAIPLPTRIVSAAYHAEMNYRIGGAERATDVLRQRAGRALDPAIVSALCRHAGELTSVLEEPSPWQQLLDLEPGEPRMVGETALDAAATALADFAEPLGWMKGHGRRVAALAVRAGSAVRLADRELADLGRAAHIHDLGQVTVALPTLDKPAVLGDLEWMDLRLHAYHSEQLVSRAPALREAGRIAGLHHERLEGSGYHRQACGAMVPVTARVLAAADVFDALTSDRPHRRSFGVHEAAAIVKDLASTGQLDASAVDAVLNAAGGARSAGRADEAASRRGSDSDEPGPAGSGGAARRPVGALRPLGLTDREVDVLRTVARGSSIKQAARLLSVSPKTVDAHLQHIYPKLGVSTRAGATLRAVECGLLDTGGG